MGSIDRDSLVQAIGISRDSYSHSFNSINSGLSNPFHSGNSSSKKGILIHFSRLKEVARIHSPNRLPFVNELEKLTIANFSGKISNKDYRSRVRSCCLKHGVSTNIVDSTQMHVNGMESNRLIPHQRRSNGIHSPLNKKSFKVALPSIEKVFLNSHPKFSPNIFNKKKSKSMRWF